MPYQARTRGRRPRGETRRDPGTKGAWPGFATAEAPQAAAPSAAGTPRPRPTYHASALRTFRAAPTAPCASPEPGVPASERGTLWGGAEHQSRPVDLPPGPPHEAALRHLRSQSQASVLSSSPIGSQSYPKSPPLASAWPMSGQILLGSSSLAGSPLLAADAVVWGRVARVLEGGGEAPRGTNSGARVFSLRAGSRLHHSYTLVRAPGRVGGGALLLRGRRHSPWACVYARVQTSGRRDRG